MTQTRSARGLVPVGGVVKPHGIRGEFCIKSYADSPSLFDAVDTLYLQDGQRRPQSFKVHSWREHKGLVLMTCQSITDRDGAEALRGRTVLVRKEDLPDLDEGEFYLHQLMGCTAVLEDGTVVGELTGFYDTGGQDTWVFVNEQGTEILLPAVDEFVLDMDPEQGTILIAPPEGLLDLYLNPDPPKKKQRPTQPRKS